jgi:hypothetical protein
LFARVPVASSKGESAQKHLADLQSASTTATCDAQPAKVSPPVEEEEPPTEEHSSGMGTLPLGLAGAGGVVAVAGALAIAASTAVYYDHEGAREAILAGEAAGADPTTLLDEQERQRTAREAWESWGSSAMIGGAVAVVVGVGIGALAISMGFE